MHAKSSSTKVGQDRAELFASGHSGTSRVFFTLVVRELAGLERKQLPLPPHSREGGSADTLLVHLTNDGGCSNPEEVGELRASDSVFSVPQLPVEVSCLLYTRHLWALSLCYWKGRKTCSSLISQAEGDCTEQLPWTLSLWPPRQQETFNRVGKEDGRLFREKI
ncbi:Melanoma-Associated Antigen 2 [Manis pentadactyla]|nr:Melanoma-Associated Antigen 2 [Manis pentadactyla]